MNIIVRACGERTESQCIELCKRHGTVHVIRATPFGESIKQTYELAYTWTQQWTPVIDADVLLHDNTIKAAIHELNSMNKNIFCLDGKTKDKIMMKDRRAGVHIYRTEMLDYAKKYIDNDHIKPESNVRRLMTAEGFTTYTGKTIFGLHDYEQYYRDLWRKSVCQTKKLERMIKNRPMTWKILSKQDPDYLVVYEGHKFGKKYNGEIKIDVNFDYDAEEKVEQLGLREKGPMR